MDPNNGNETNPGGQTQDPAAAASQPSATDTNPQSQQPGAGEGGEGQGSGANAGNDGKPDGEADPKPKDGEGGDPKPKEGEGGTQEGAPESYEAFTLPEGWTLEGERLDAFVALAKRANLTQAEAQAEIDRFVQDAGSALGNRASQQIEAWADQLKADPEFGGAGLQANLMAAGQAVAEFGGQQLIDDLNTYGLGNLPSLNKAFLGVSKALAAARAEIAELKAEGSMPGMGSGSSGGQKTIAERMYPGSSKS